VIFEVKFIGEGVCGDVPSMQLVREESSIRGSGSNIYIVSDKRTYVGRNGGDRFESVNGNSLLGFFRLSLGGHMTEMIPFDASASVVKHLNRGETST